MSEHGAIAITSQHAASIAITAAWQQGAPAIGEELTIPFLIGEVTGSVISLTPGRQALITIESE